MVQARRIALGLKPSPEASIDSTQKAHVTGRAERRFQKNRARTPHVWGRLEQARGAAVTVGGPVSVRGSQADSLAPFPGRAPWPAPYSPASCLLSWGHASQVSVSQSASALNSCASSAFPKRPINIPAATGGGGSPTIQGAPPPSPPAPQPSRPPAPLQALPAPETPTGPA